MALLCPHERIQLLQQPTSPQLINLSRMRQNARNINTSEFSRRQLFPILPTEFKVITQPAMAPLSSFPVSLPFAPIPPSTDAEETSLAFLPKLASLTQSSFTQKAVWCEPLRSDRNPANLLQPLLDLHGVGGNQQSIIRISRFLLGPAVRPNLPRRTRGLGSSHLQF